MSGWYSGAAWSAIPESMNPSRAYHIYMIFVYMHINKLVEPITCLQYLYNIYIRIDNLIEPITRLLGANRSSQMHTLAEYCMPSSCKEQYTRMGGCFFACAVHCVLKKGISMLHSMFHLDTS